jgi:hypothetical protein
LLFVLLIYLVVISFHLFKHAFLVLIIVCFLRCNELLLFVLLLLPLF